jgi:hypothetical protein
MTKNLILGILASVLLGIAAILYFKNNDQSKDNFVDPYLEKANFAYEKIDEIATIYIKRPNYPLLVFKKPSGKWVINDRFPANDETMVHLLAVLQRMKVKYIPPTSMNQTLQDDIKKNGIEVKLFKEDNSLVKHYFVGTDFGGGTDTPVMNSGDNQPFMMQLAGLEGTIRNRLNFGLAEWRTKTVFEENADEIKKIKVDYPQDEKSGFTLLRFNDNFKVLDFQGNELVDKTANQNTIGAYFDFFTNIRGESNETENSNRNAIIKNKPFAVIKIVSSDNLERKYEFIPALDLLTDTRTVSPNDVNPDNKYFVTTYNNNFLLVQHRIAGKFLKPIWYFFN